MKVFIFCALPQDEILHLCARPQDEGFHLILFPVVKVLIFCGRPQDEGLKWPHTYNYFLSVYGWAIGFIYYKSIVIIVVALNMNSFWILIMHLQLFVVLLLSGIKSI